MPILELYLLGTLRLIYDHAPITINSPRLQSLLAYLVLHRDAPQARRDLAFLFWANSSEAQAMTNLRKSLHELRHVLPDPDRFLQIDTHEVQWRPNAPFTIDTVEFENAVRRASTVAERQAAVDLYHGDLLPSCYDDWIIPDRERLRQTFIDTLEQLIAQQESQREYRGAIAYAHRLLQEEPLREETYLRLMRLYNLCGDRTSALRTYHACATALQRELDIEPSQATRRAYEQLLKLDVSFTQLPAAIPRLVGRDQEWVRLQHEWREAAQGRPHWVVLTGEVGIGKTRLAEELVQWAARQGISTVNIRCSASESHMAFAPVAAWLRARPLPLLESIWLSEIARLLPEIAAQHPNLPPARPFSEPGARQRLAEALARAVLASPALLVLIDDLQWCDRDTLEWLHYLLRFDPQAQLLLVSTLRLADVEPDHPLTSLLPLLRSKELLTEIALDRLTEAETARLVSQALGQELDPEKGAKVYHYTEGNPLFVLELVRAGLSPDGAPSTVPPTIEAVMEARVARLSLEARGVLEVAATLGRAFTSAEIIEAAGIREDALMRALDELWKRRILRERGGNAYEFSHVLMSQMVYQNTSPARKSLLHRRVAEALLTLNANDLDAVSGEIARHFELAGQLDEAIKYYLRAGDAARRIHANEAAASHYQHVLSLLPKKEPLV